MKKSVTYRQTGVDIEKAEKSLSEIKNKISRTHNKNVLKDIGSFGGFYQFPVSKYRKPVLVSSTDGVGTKLKVAIMMNLHHTIGQDLVNHCINDIAVCGAEPLFFLDYYACGELQPDVYQQIIEGLTTACYQAELPLIGGETAEMPDVYRQGDYDLAGTIVGVVEKDAIIDGSKIVESDVIIGVASNGLHTNGYTLARKVLFNHYQPEDFLQELGCSIGEELLKIHLNYYPVIKACLAEFPVKGMAHITGGGLYKNSIRVIPPGLAPDFQWDSWPVPPIFNLIQKLGNIPTGDMRQTFNLGIGLVFIIDQSLKNGFLDFAKRFPFPFYPIGEIRKKIR